jgi:Carboxypeptidase regulatory-like domain/Putative zinc-finger
MQHLDEGTIHAWLDGQLPPQEATAVEAHIAECRQCADAVAEARGLIAASSRILMSLDSVPGDVLPVPAVTRPEPGLATDGVPRSPSAAEQRAHRRWLSGPSLAAAAAIVVAVGTFSVMRAGGRADLSKEVAASPSVVSGPAVDSAVVSTPAPTALPPAAPADERAEAVGKVRDGKAENASSERRALADVAPQQLSARAAAETVAKDGFIDRAQVARQASQSPPQPAPAPPQIVASNELKKTSASDSGLAPEKRFRDTNTVIISRSAAAVADRSNAAGARADAARATATTGIVRGRVTDANGTGLADAMVSVVGTGTGVPTSNTGEFTLGGVEPGTRRLQARRIGYQPTTRDVTVVAGQTAAAEIVLAPSQVALSEVVTTGTAASVAVPARKRANAPAIETPPGAPVPASQSNAVGCYELGITATGAQARTGFRQVPRRLALEADIVPANAEGVWYRARDLSRVGTLPNGLWRPAGTDAVELEWNYGTRTDRLRLSGPAGSMMRGTIEEIDRATATGEAGTVVAVRRPCDG